MRISLKVVMSRLPVPYGLWKSLQIFEHGDMNQPNRALDNFFEHANTGGVIDFSKTAPKFTVSGSDFSVLELGPGDALFSAIIAKSMGASRSWLVDSGAYAMTDIQIYKEFCAFLQTINYPVHHITKVNKLGELLDQCGSVYLTEGVHSLVHIPSSSVDFCFSNAVLEHIPKQDFVNLANELFRLIKRDGVCVHRIDLRDHLGGGLNNLRFSDKLWEGELFKSSGFYTNRIRFSEMVDCFRSVGFHCDFPRVIRWKQLPIKRSALNNLFDRFSDEDLLVSGFDLVLRKG